MNTNKKTLSIVERAKKTFVGKIVCRMMGEERGTAAAVTLIIVLVAFSAIITEITICSISSMFVYRTTANWCLKYIITTC